MEKLVRIETPLTRLVAAWKAARELHDMSPTPENLQAMRIYSRQLIDFRAAQVLENARKVFADVSVSSDKPNLIALAEASAYLEFWGLH